MKEQNPENHNNSILLSLIDLWAEADESSETYDDVIFELSHGNSFLIIETRDRIGSIEIFDTNQDVVLQIPYNVVEGEIYFCAFTDLDLFGEFASNPAFYTMLKGKHLLEMIERDDLAGIVINTNSENVFVAYPRRDKALEEIFNL
jgi:hypothetical protein